MAFRKSKKAAHPLWRPDFKDPENLPDIKVIRTDFLLNVISVSMALALLCILAFREYRSSSVSQSIDTISNDIALNEAANAEKIRLSAEFRNLQNGMKEFARFQNVPALPDQLLLGLAQMQPDGIILDSISFNGVISKPKGSATDVTTYSLVLTGTVDDSSAGMGSRTITEYRSALTKIPALQRYFKSSELSGFSRNEALALFNFTIRVELSDEPMKDAS